MVLGQEQLCDEEQTLLPSSCVNLPACHLAPCSEAFGLLPKHQNRYQLEKKPFPTLFTKAPKHKGQPFCHFSPQLCTTAQPAHKCQKPARTWRLALSRAQSSDPVQALLAQMAPSARFLPIPFPHLASSPPFAANLLQECGAAGVRRAGDYI